MEVKEEEEEEEEGKRPIASPDPPALLSKEPQIGSSREPAAAAEPNLGQVVAGVNFCGAYVPQAATLRCLPAKLRPTRLPQPERPQGRGLAAVAAAEVQAKAII